MSEAQRLKTLFLGSKCADGSDNASHLYWCNPSNVPMYARITAAQEYNLAEQIGLAFLQSYNRDTHAFYGTGLPAIHELGTEIFPLFLDIDHIPLEADTRTTKANVVTLIDDICRYAINVEPETEITIFTNNRNWMIHDNMPEGTGFEKYGVHLYFGDPSATMATAYALASWCQEQFKKCTLNHGVDLTCIACHPKCNVDVGLFHSRSLLKPKMRLPYCCKGHPYQNQFYGLWFKVKWDGKKVLFLSPLAHNGGIVRSVAVAEFISEAPMFDSL